MLQPSVLTLGALGLLEGFCEPPRLQILASLGGQELADPQPFCLWGLQKAGGGLGYPRHAAFRGSQGGPPAPACSSLLRGSRSLAGAQEGAAPNCPPPINYIHELIAKQEGLRQRSSPCPLKLQ